MTHSPKIAYTFIESRSEAAIDIAKDTFVVLELELTPQKTDYSLEALRA